MASTTIGRIYCLPAKRCDGSEYEGDEGPAMRILITIDTPDGPRKLRLDAWNARPEQATDPAYVVTECDAGMPSTGNSPNGTGGPQSGAATSQSGTGSTQ